MIFGGHTKVDLNRYFKAHSMTEAEEQKAIDLAVQNFNNHLQKLNKKHKHIQVTGLKIQINHPAPVDAVMSWDWPTRIRMWWANRKLKAVNEKNAER